MLGSEPDTPIDEDFNRLIPRKEWAADLGVGSRQAFNIEQSDPDFPQVIYRANRAFITDTGYARYKQALLRRGRIGAGTVPTGMYAGKVQTGGAR